MESEDKLSPDTVADILAQRSAGDLDSGVEKEQMFASLHSSLFGQAPKVRLGRFELGARLGAGAMGVVFEAHDPELDRKVALKVLRSSDLQDSRVERFKVEARALAKLRHPNVVTVYEVGSDGDESFIVMDLLQGGTLRAWLKESRPWREVVRMFLAAGEGLRAAHAAGLVHRDFKPDNVLIEAGQPRVVDFGLAAAADDPHETTLRELADSSVVVDRCTRTGAFVGTPAYMAPEQYRGQATPAADQYAFCVALFEALDGRRPYASAESDGLAGLLAPRPPLPTTVPAGVPRWLRRVLARGLAEDPADRWPSMDALLNALRRAEGQGGRRWVVAGGFVLVVAGAAALGTRWNAGAPDPCAGAADAVEEAWSSARRRELERAFEATELVFAPETWARVEPVLDAYATAWNETSTRACAADLAAPEPLPPLNVARAACLQRRLADFESLLDAFAAPDADLVERAVDAATTIPPLSRCDEAILLREQLERGRDRSVAPAELYASFSAADAAHRTGADAADATRDVLERARGFGDRELEALAARLLAQALARQGALDEGLAAVTDGVEAAELLGDTRLRTSLRLELLSVLTEQRSFEAATRQSRFSDAAVRRLGDPATLRNRLDVLHGWLLLNQGELKLALEQFERAEQQLMQQDAVAPTAQANVLAGKGAALEQLGRHPEAVDSLRTSVALQVERLGPSSPRVISSRLKLSTSLANLGRADEGIEQAKLAVTDAENALGENSLLAARARATLAIAYASVGKLDEAEALLRAAAVVIEDHYGPKSAESATAWMNLARVLPYLSKSAEAVEVLEHAGAILSHTLPADHPDFVFIKTNLTEAHLELEAWDEALQTAREAEAIGRVHFPDDSARLAQTRIHIGIALRGQGELAESRRTLEATVDELTGTKARSGLVALARYELALTETEAGHIDAARVLMQSARSGFEKDGMHKTRVEAITAWLERHP